MKIVAIVQARMGSTRLPGKVMKQLKGRSVIAHVLQRLSLVKELDQIIVATTNLSIDDVIVEEVLNLGVSVYRGSELDVLSRYYKAALETEASIIVRITADCPLIDPEVTSAILNLYKNSRYDYISNTLSRTYPRGLDVEVFSFKSLELAYYDAVHLEFREHVTPYIYNHPNQFKLFDYRSNQDFSQYRWTLDTIEDWELINKIYNELYEDNRTFSWKRVLQLMREQPSLVDINAHIEQKKISVSKGIE